jgi:hypothetical protein
VNGQLKFWRDARILVLEGPSGFRCQANLDIHSASADAWKMSLWLPGKLLLTALAFSTEQQVWVRHTPGGTNQRPHTCARAFISLLLLAIAALPFLIHNTS